MLVQLSVCAAAEFAMARFEPVVHHLRPSAEAVHAKGRPEKDLIVDQHAPRRNSRRDGPAIVQIVYAACAREIREELSMGGELGGAAHILQLSILSA